jgi:spore cortex biosynthesis protein YabQ
MTLSVQFYTMIAMIGMGSYFGAALDTYNRFLKRSSRKGWIVFINDFLFWIVQGLFIFYVLFLVNEGELRFYLFLALLLGFSAYQALLKVIYNVLLEQIIRFFIATAVFTAKSFQTLIFQPIKWIIASVIFMLMGLLKGIYRLLTWIFNIFVSILKLFLRPLSWILKEIWDFLPKSVTKVVVKIYNKCTGIILRIKNSINRLITNWKNKSN